MKKVPSVKVLWILVPLILFAGMITMVIAHTPKEEFFSDWSDYSSLFALCSDADLIVVARVDDCSESCEVIRMTATQILQGRQTEGSQFKVKSIHLEMPEPGEEYLLFLKGPVNPSLDIPYLLVSKQTGCYRIVHGCLSIPDSDPIFEDGIQLEQVSNMIAETRSSKDAKES